MVIDLKKVSLALGGKEILKGISFSFGEDMDLGIIGPNGSGKTCLLRLMGADLIPSSGAITLLGYRVGNADLRVLRRQIGFVSQAVIEPNLRIDMSVFDLVASGILGTFGLNERLLYAERSAETVRNMVYAKLALLDIDHLAQAKYFACSAGERMRALLARAMINNQPLLILDEPCNGLDIVQKRKFIDFLASLHEYGIKTVTVSHDWSDFHPNIKQMLAIKRGELIGMGEREEILSRDFLQDLFETTLP